MPRKKRIKIKFTEESVNQFMQEVYNESFTLRSKMDILFRTWETKIKENDDIALIGSELVKIINAISKNQDQKIQILKLLKDVVFVDKQLNDGNIGDKSKSQLSREEMLKIADEQLKKLEDLGDIEEND